MQRIVFTDPTPRLWAMMVMDENGNTWETSNLPSSVFTTRAYQDFRAAEDSQSSLIPLQRRPQFKRNRGNIREEPPNTHCLESSDNLVPLKIGETVQVTDYYKSAFKILQHANCRLLAKVFIKVVEPRKQVKHPYKGRRGSGKNRDPELTKPDWWPCGVPHKEPDHLLRARRSCLDTNLVVLTYKH